MLKVKRVSVDTTPENTVFLSRECSVYRAEEFTALKKIEIISKARTILATLIIADDPQIVADDELGLAEPAFHRLGLPENAHVESAHAAPPSSLDAIRDKIDGAEMTSDEIEAIINDITAFRYSPMEIATFLISSASSPVSFSYSRRTGGA